MSDYITRSEAAALAGITVSTLQSHRFPGDKTRKTPFPEPARHFGRSPVWLRSDVEAWAAGRDRKPGAAANVQR